MRTITAIARPRETMRTTATVTETDKTAIVLHRKMGIIIRDQTAGTIAMSAGDTLPWWALITLAP